MKSMIQQAKDTIRSYYNKYRIRKLIKLQQKENYTKIASMFKKTADYHDLKVDSFPFLFYLISEDKNQAVKVFLNKITFKDQILINDQNPLKCSPIVFAALEAKEDIIQIIEESGGNLNIPNSESQNLLHLAAIYRRNQAFQLGVRKGINVNLQDQFGNTPFHYACRGGIIEMITTMIIAKASKVSNLTHQYPIHMSIESGQYNAFLLLQGDLDNSYPNYHPIHSAVRCCNQTIFKHVIKNRKKLINYKDYKGLTPLHHAVIIDNLSMVKLVLAQPQVQVDLTDIYGNSSLHLALMGNNLDIIQQLINRNANLDLVNDDHMTPAEYGLSSPQSQIIGYIKGLGSRSKKITQWSSIKY